jgi:excisionase family DNA binding protein
VEVFTVKEAAEFLRVTPETVRRLCRRGKIPFAKIGSDYRFLQRDLEALFLEQEARKMSREDSLRLLGTSLKIP